mgnify:CR=1 FL=1
MTFVHKYTACLLALVSASSVFADDLAIDKVYHPYVQPLERELEWRMISADGEQLYRLSLGTALSDRIFVEGYLTAADTNNDNFDIAAYELEMKYQLTEQGEYSADWGIVTELEKEDGVDIWEASTGLIAEKEWGKWVGTANLHLIYEWGDDVNDELESSLALQSRYRYSRHFEPAIEFYSGQNTRGLGPVAMGDVKLSGAKKVHWEAGAIFGLDSKTPDTTLRLLTEFEF